MCEGGGIDAWLLTRETIMPRLHASSHVEGWLEGDVEFGLSRVTAGWVKKCRVRVCGEDAQLRTGGKCTWPVRQLQGATKTEPRGRCRCGC